MLRCRWLVSGSECSPEELRGFSRSYVRHLEEEASKQVKEKHAIYTYNNKVVGMSIESMLYLSKILT